MGAGGSKKGAGGCWWVLGVQKGALCIKMCVWWFKKGSWWLDKGSAASKRGGWWLETRTGKLKWVLVSEHHGFRNPAGSAGRVRPGKGKGQEILTLPNPYPYEWVWRVVA